MLAAVDPETEIVQNHIISSGHVHMVQFNDRAHPQHSVLHPKYAARESPTLLVAIDNYSLSSA
jgi:hypothetical protein